MARRSVTLSIKEIGQLEQMAAVGLRPRTMAFILGISPDQLRTLIKRDREALAAGKAAKPTSAYLAISRGRAKGDVELVRLAFDLARGTPARYDADGRQTHEERPPNVTVLLHLLKARIGLQPVDAPAFGQVGAGKGQAALPPGPIIFETQVGMDGVIRRSERPLEDAAPSAPVDDGRDAWLM